VGESRRVETLLLVEKGHRAISRGRVVIRKMMTQTEDFTVWIIHGCNRSKKEGVL